MQVQNHWQGGVDNLLDWFTSDDEFPMVKVLIQTPTRLTAITHLCELLLTFSEGRQWTLEFLGVTRFSRLENRLYRDVYTVRLPI